MCWSCCRHFFFFFDEWWKWITVGLNACLAATYGQMYINNIPILLYMWIYLTLKPGALIVSWSFLGRLSNKFHIYSPFGSAWMNISLWWDLDNTVLCQFVNISYVLVNWWLIQFYKFIWNHHLIKYFYHEIGLGVDLNFHSDSSQMSSVEFGSELCSSTPDQPIFIWTSLKRPCETRLLKH